MAGLSPRGRGNRLQVLRCPRRVGSIPARAREPGIQSSLSTSPGVYPRAGGGTQIAAAVAMVFQGLSPRGRGNRSRPDRRRGDGGSIPARAGEPSPASPAAPALRVYPRAGGGTKATAKEVECFWGLSPRGRGNLATTASAASSIGSIPARAGEPPFFCPHFLESRVYPRAGGGTPPGFSGPSSKPGLSPRGRGNRADRIAARPRVGSIPARAGEPTSSWCRSPPARVYPRAGGGTEVGNALFGDLAGLSPRGRGNHAQGQDHGARDGSIPARAGEPALRERPEIGKGVYPRAGGGTDSERMFPND